MIRAGIVGGAGYVGGELLRLLIFHPDVQLEYVLSQSQGGRPVSDIHKDLTGWTDLTFTNTYDANIDVLFLCSGHGASKVFLDENMVNPEILIIDLSRDFRISHPSNDYVYGLTELNKTHISENKRIANPGCFATCIQLGLLPLAEAGLLKNEIHITAITGSTGAGQKPSDTTHFSWRNNNVSVYKAFQHQHLEEIIQSIRQLQRTFDSDINFIPIRGNFTRGIFANIYTECDAHIEEIKNIYTEFFYESPFVFISENSLTVKDAVNTNNAFIHIQKFKNKCRIESVIDNLLKGAAGQAVQNMNVSLNLDEKAGLRLKPSAF